MKIGSDLVWPRIFCRVRKCSNIFVYFTIGKHWKEIVLSSVVVVVNLRMYVWKCNNCTMTNWTLLVLYFSWWNRETTWLRFITFVLRKINEFTNCNSLVEKCCVYYIMFLMNCTSRKTVDIFSHDEYHLGTYQITFLSTCSRNLAVYFI